MAGFQNGLGIGKRLDGFDLDTDLSTRLSFQIAEFAPKTGAFIGRGHAAPVIERLNSQFGRDNVGKGDALKRIFLRGVAITIFDFSGSAGIVQFAARILFQDKGRRAEVGQGDRFQGNPEIRDQRQQNHGKHKHERRHQQRVSEPFFAACQRAFSAAPRLFRARFGHG